VANVDLEQWAKDTGVSLDEGARAIKIEVFTDVIDNTRIQFGRLRGNWQTSTGSPATGEIDRLDPEGSNKANDEVEMKVRADTVDYLTNNLPYAEVWEERDGMVAKALARVESIVRRTTK
jgi:hypothetical protein